jgi:putative oxidoreductase
MTATPSTRVRTRPTAASLAVAVVQAVLALQFAAGGLLKLTGAASMVEMFDDIGAGAGLRVLVGALELAAAIGLLVPRLAGAAAAGLVALMVGATITNIAVLHTSPALPVVFLLAAGLVAYTRRSSLTRR